MKVFIIGSGATFGTLSSSCPTMQGFGTALHGRLAAQGKRLEDKYPELAKVVADLWPEQKDRGSAWHLAHVWTRIDYFSKFPALRCGGDYGARASFELRAALLEVYGSELLEELDGLLASGRGFTLLDIVAEVRPGDVVVSFNWDVAFEKIAARMGLNLVQAPHLVTTGVRFIKPHGSVSWRHYLSGECRVDKGSTSAPSTSPMQADEVISHCINGSAGDCVEPFVIGAVPIKSELIKEAQREHPEVYFILMDQWRCLMDALEEADEVIVAGYNFPDDDVYGRFLIKEAIAKKGRLFRRLYFYELDKAEATMRSRLNEIFRPGTTQIFRGPVTA